MATENGHLEWDVVEIANALKITESEATIYFKDGRRISFLIERRIARDVLNGNIATSEGASYDIIDEDGNMWKLEAFQREESIFARAIWLALEGHLMKKVSLIN